MFYLVKIVSAIILPPGLFIVLLAVAAVFAFRKGSKTAGILVTVTAVLLAGLSIVPGSNLLLFPLENRYPPFYRDRVDSRELSKAKAIVVLGAGLIDASPQEAGRSALDSRSLARVVYGVRLHKQLHLPMIFTGAALDNPTGKSWADVAARTAEELGVPQAQITEEGASMTTWENAANVARIVGGGPVVVVTSAVHMPRAVLSFSRNGVASIPAPTDYLAQRDGYNLLSFLPNAAALDNSSFAMHELVGIVAYSLRGAKPAK